MLGRMSEPRAIQGGPGHSAGTSFLAASVGGYLEAKYSIQMRLSYSFQRKWIGLAETDPLKYAIQSTFHRQFGRKGLINSAVVSICE